MQKKSYICDSLTCGLNALSSGHAKEVLGVAVKKLVALATDRRKPIVREDLDFVRKKRQMEYREKRQNRKLSALIYSKAAAMVEARVYQPYCQGQIYEVKESVYSLCRSLCNRAKGDGIFGKTAILSQPSCTKNTEEPLENRLYPRKKGGFFLLPGGSACMG